MSPRTLSRIPGIIIYLRKHKWMIILILNEDFQNYMRLHYECLCINTQCRARIYRIRAIPYIRMGMNRGRWSSHREKALMFLVHYLYCCYFIPMVRVHQGFDLIGLLPFTPLFTIGFRDIAIEFVQCAHNICFFSLVCTNEIVPFVWVRVPPKE